MKNKSGLFLLSVFTIFIITSCSAVKRPSSVDPTQRALDAINEIDFPDYKDLSKVGNQEPPNQAYLPLKYTLNLYIDPAQKTLAGIIKIKIKKVEDGKPLIIDMADTLVLDGLVIEQDTLTNFSRENNQLIISQEALLGDKFELTIYYHTYSFRTGSHFIKLQNENVQFWTHGEPLDTKFWMPCFDWPVYKAPIDATIFVPKGWKALSNGALKESGDIGSSRSFYRWSEKVKIPSYLYSVLAGEFNVHSVSKTSVPMSFWLPLKEDPMLIKGFNSAPEMMKIYSNLFGDYAFEKFDVGIAYDYLGAMEHASAVTFSQNLSSERDGYSQGILAHEMAHQWFGDLVTCKTWNDLWLNEGFASYFEVVFAEKYISTEEYFNRINSYRKRYFGEDLKGEESGKVGPVYNPDNAASQKFNTASYVKGALALHSLRYHLGDKVFFKVIKEYVDKYKFKSADTEDFRTVAENVSGQNLKTFFEQWVYKPAHPYFKYSWKWNKEKAVVELTVSQIQKEKIGLFETPLDIYLDFKQQSRTEKIFVRAKPVQTFELAASKEPQFVVLDPHHWVLSQVKGEKTKDEWREILFSGPTTSSKLDALAEIETLGFETLNEFIESNPNEALLAAAISKLSKFKNETKALTIARESLKSAQDMVRMYAAQVLGQLGDKESEDALIEVFERDPISYAAVFAASSMSQVGSEKSALSFTRELYREPRRAANFVTMAVSGVQALNYKAAVPRILELFEDDQTLVPAKFLKMMFASTLAYFKETKATAGICKELLLEKTPGLSKGLISALTTMEDKTGIPCLEIVMQDKTRSPDVRQAAMAALKAINSVK